ncbi:MAG: DNA-processing protein DprA [Roseburia sp.]|nr:DNA-processing protein DprA [Roseburia sp.]
MIKEAEEDTIKDTAKGTTKSAAKNTMEEQRMYACWLDTGLWLDRRIKHMLLRAAGTPKEIYAMTDGRADAQLAALVGEKNRDRLKEHRRQHPEQIWDKMSRSGIQYTFCKATDFPERLTNIPDPPFGLFYKGELPAAQAPSVAVIGARKCSEYGRYMAEHITEGLVRYGVDIISGMAMGIDGISQRKALKSGGRSYGVLGCGADVIYPPSNEPLYRMLLAEGGVLSEYPPQTAPRAALFPPRNRIISALADAVLVIEAREKSGTFITVDMALEQGREVYAVPGRCTDELSVGCNKLLRQGAGVAISAEDIMDDMGWERAAAGEKAAAGRTETVSLLGRAVYDALQRGTLMTQEELVLALRMKGDDTPVAQICGALVELQLNHLIEKTGGAYRRR